jgi:glycine cleavage system H protein
MKELEELNLPEALRYAEDHEWARPEKDRVRIGITDFAQDQLGDIVFVELPRAGDAFERGAQIGTVESVKTVAELFTPLAGEILAVNAALEGSPELVNQDPYDKGWMIELKPADPAELDRLMGRDAYLQMLREKK